MRPAFTLQGALLLAALSTCVFVALLTSYDGVISQPEGARGLLATVDQAYGGEKSLWAASRIAGIVLSVLVSLTSTVDREAGACLYMVVFSVLIDLPFRNAIAMTAFTMACGSLAPAIASMSEPHVTEKGVVALVDYPGALILLPTMFWGLSIGVIVNMWFPSWLLALLWVFFIAASNIELTYSLVKILRLRKQARAYGPQLLQLNAQLAEGGAASSSKLAAEAAASCKDTSSDAAAADTKILVADADATKLAREQTLQKLLAIRAESEQVESIALLYPAFHIPSFQQVLKSSGVAVPRFSEVLQAASAPSTVALVKEQQAEMLQLQQAQRYRTSRFTWRWKDWWKLQNHFEFGLVLKVVVLHLVTEAARHRTAKPCTKHYWFMLLGMTGLVTFFLMFVVTSYSRRRLWRGPHWVDALQVVTEIKKQQKASSGDLAAAAEQDAATLDQEPAAAAKPTSAAAAAGVGEALAVTVDESEGGKEEQQKKRGCCGKLCKKLPWVWAPPAEAIINVSACNSHNQYKNWQMPRLLASAAVTQVIGILACALGLPAGPAMAYLLIGFGLKPHVVAGTSRFLVLCFCFGCFVAYLIAGNLHRQLALAFGLLNLGLAPLGMLLFRKLQLPTHLLLMMSLVMGVVGMVGVAIWQMVPLMAHLAGTADQLLPHNMAHHFGVQASIQGTGNEFDLSRFCLAHNI